MPYIAIIIIAGAVAVDQLIKLWVINSIDVGRYITAIDGVLNISHIRNFGAAFSILQNRQIFLILITIAALIIAAIVLFKNIGKYSPIVRVGLSLIIGGGIGNLIDRIRLGYVVDYIDVRFVDYPVFNFADCCVVIGAILLVAGVIASELSKNRGK